MVGCVIGTEGRSRSRPVPTGFTTGFEPHSVQPGLGSVSGSHRLVRRLRTRRWRSFKAVGANTVASHVGVSAVTAIDFDYVVAPSYAIAGLALAGLLRTRGVAGGHEYLLGPMRRGDVAP